MYRTSRGGSDANRNLRVSRLISILFGAFSGLALVLAGVGLYSVVSYSVVQRTGEFGIRMALGAQRADVLRIVVWSAGVECGDLGLASGAGAQPRVGQGDHALGGKRSSRSADRCWEFRCW